MYSQGKIFIIYEQTEKSDYINDFSVQHGSNVQDFLSSDIGRNFSVKTEDMKDELTYREKSLEFDDHSNEKKFADTNLDIHEDKIASIYPYYDSNSPRSSKIEVQDIKKFSILEIFFKYHEVKPFIVGIKLAYNIPNEDTRFNAAIISLYFILERHCIHLGNSINKGMNKNELLKKTLKNTFTTYKFSDKFIACIYKLMSKLAQYSCLQNNIVAKKILQKTYNAYARHNIRNFISLIHLQTNQDIKLI